MAQGVLPLAGLAGKDGPVVAGR